MPKSTEAAGAEIPFLSRSPTFFSRFDRKDGNPQLTHYCPGCGHGIVHKLIAEAIDDLGIQDRTILANSVGCSVFAYYYFDVGNVQCSHGRAPAVATGIKRSRPDSIVLCYQGDGDLAAIGGNEILHAANRGEGITVIFVNNAIYGMTGGQMAPTTLVGQKTTTTPSGRDPSREGFPLRIVELLDTLKAPAFLARVSLHDAKNTMRARKAIRKAIRNQMEGKGFSLVEVLSTCPTGWKMDPVESCKWIREKMLPDFPLAEVRDNGNLIGERNPSPSLPGKEDLMRILGLDTETRGIGEVPPRLERPLGAKLAGFGGQGVLHLGLALAEAGMAQGYQVSWLPSYGPEMRGGTAHCHVTLSSDPVSSPVVTRPTLLVAMNQPSVDRFTGDVQPGGLVLYDSSRVGTFPDRHDIQRIAIPATQIAKSIGNPKVANMVLLGALAAHLGVPARWSIARALVQLVPSNDLRIANESAIEAGWLLGRTAA